MTTTPITVTGNLAYDPELRYTQQGKPVTNLTVMTSRRVQQGDEWVDADTTPWRVTAWDQMAENVAEALRKGDPVIVVGFPAEKSWEKDGQTYRRIEVTARNIGYDLRNRALPTLEGDGGGQSTQSVPVAPSTVPPLRDEDVPF